jgi:hydrogenase maturation protease
VTPEPARVLIAGLGNIFLGDDAFGVEVVRRLSTITLPTHVRVADIGLRVRELAYDMLDGRYDTVILVDAISRGAAPGTLHVLEPDTEDVHGDSVTGGHSIQPHEAMALLRQLGGEEPTILIVGCEPLRIGPDAGLSAAVAAVVDEAVDLVLQLASPPLCVSVRNLD